MNPQPKFKNEEWAFSWSLPYYVDQGFLIVGSLDPQRYIFEQSEWRLIFTPHDIQMYILSEWLDAGWIPAQPLRNAPFWWSLQ
ncbi:hypothetical protein Q5692_24990 [Microcoleus sp. C2C3]|uniref:hypothetical protein n=1 Tax=unclassified Microcoleus TaxID=2642155 RepID=UPI002FD17235